MTYIKYIFTEFLKLRKENGILQKESPISWCDPIIIKRKKKQNVNDLGESESR